MENSKKDNSYAGLEVFFKIADKLIRIRNQIFHQKRSIKELDYNGGKIIERETQNRMIIDFGSNFAGLNNK